MTRSHLVRLAQVLFLGALSVACSGRSDAGAEWLGEPTSETPEEPAFDARALGASIICDWVGPSGESHPFVFVLSALNHKLATYPEFAAQAGFDFVSDCGGARRFVEAYGEYSTEHPGFDADEPLGETPEVEATPPPIAPDEDDFETTKIAGAAAATNYPVVQLTYRTCKPVNGKPSCARADASWIVRGNDYRNWRESCSGTFIAKNWILTAAHCMVWPAIDQCMQKGIARANCRPNWDLYGSWRIQGRFRTGSGPDGIVPSADDPTDGIDESFAARGYIMKENWSAGGVGHWAGSDLGRVDITCDTPGCFDAGLVADHDLALMYIRAEYDDRLPPRTEEDAAKRLSIVAPPANLAPWQLAIAGWGNPGDDVLRQGTNLGAVTQPANSSRLEVRTTGAVYACSGDSGGPVLRTGLNLQTNTGPRTNLEAIAAVMSVSQATCDPAPPPAGTAVTWMATRVDTDLHRRFIRETFQRWPNYKHFDCVPRKIGTPPPAGAINEVQECWGSPCTDAGGLPNGCADGQYCNGPGRLVARRARTCAVCDLFTAAADAGCGCIQGQCLPLGP